MKRNLFLDQRYSFGRASRDVFLHAKELRKNMTVAEVLLWEKLRRKNILNVKFRRQHPFNRYVLDFYAVSIKLVIEIDGEYHLSESQKEMDEGREEFLRDYGMHIIRFTNEQVLHDTNNVMEEIEEVVIKLAKKRKDEDWK